MGKDLTEVHSSQRTLIPDAEDWEYYELPALRGIARKAKQEPTHRFRDLSRCLNETHWRYAFSKMNKRRRAGSIMLPIKIIKNTLMKMQRSL
jgi:hypothetical protein